MGDMESNTVAYDQQHYMRPQNETGARDKDKNGGFKKSVYELEYWIEAESVLALLTILSIYVFVCILRYTATKKTSSRDASGKQGKRLYMMLVVASGFTVLRMISDHVVAFLSSKSDTHCFATIAASTVLYALGLLSVYIFLWMRQSIFYANPVLAKVLNRGVTFASWSTLVFMIVSAVCLTVLYNVPAVNGWDYQVTEDGCKGVLTGNDEIVAAVATATTVYFQISLLALFLYPLLSRKTQKYRSAGNQNTGEDGTSRARASSLSNTDDNLTDGDHSASYGGKIEKHKLAKTIHNEYPAIHEADGGVDVGSPNDSIKTSEAQSNEGENDSRRQCNGTGMVNGGANPLGANDKTKLKSADQKRPSIFNAPRLFKARSIFYRRNPKRKPTSPSSPISKLSQDRMQSSLSQQTENGNSDRDRKSSVGTQKRERKRRQKRARRTQQGRRMMAYLRKSFYMMMVCVITDVACTVVQAQVNVPEIVYLVIFDLNLLINVVCITMSFRDWDVILFPLCARSEKRINGRGTIGATNGGARPDPTAAKRRAVILRSVMSNGTRSPGVLSPRTDSPSFSYDPLPYDKKSETPGPQINSLGAKELDLNGKT